MMRFSNCWRSVFVLFLSLGVCSWARLTIKGTHFYLGSQRVFLSGGNLPWIQYGRDFGNGQWMEVKDQVRNQMKLLHEAGGNSLRLWVHVQGESSPVFDPDGFVVQLDHTGTFVSDFLYMLNMARSFNILIFPTLWNAAIDGNHHHEGLTGLIRNTTKLNSYINNALIPLVAKTKGHPALGGWDVINEPEGFINPLKTGGTLCFDSYTLRLINIGWAGWLLDLGYEEILSNECLILAGNKTLGTLDFYQVHSYAFLGKYDRFSPFKHSAWEYNLTKPLLVGEFEEQSISISEMFHHVISQAMGTFQSIFKIRRIRFFFIIF